MNIILGASGQVGSIILEDLISNNMPVRAVVRDPKKVNLKEVAIKKADVFNGDDLKRAFEGATTAFLLTPQDPSSNDIIRDTERIVGNYRMHYFQVESLK